MKSGSAKVARRYAKAMLALTDECGDGQQVRRDLDGLAAVLAQAPDVAAFLADPTTAADARQAVLGKLLASCGVEGSARNLACLLLDKGRMTELPLIAQQFGALIDARSNRTEAQVTSAVALSADAAARLQATLRGLLGKDVTLVQTVDADLLGGMVVRVGNTVYDTSVRNHLNRLRHQMLA